VGDCHRESWRSTSYFPEESWVSPSQEHPTWCNSMFCMYPSKILSVWFLKWFWGNIFAQDVMPDKSHSTVSFLLSCSKVCMSEALS
jgi:hypothetical protein